MIKHMKRNLAAGAACAVALGLLVAPQAAVATGAGTAAAADVDAAAPGVVNLLNFNDFHGRLQAPSGTTADPTPRGGTVGFAGTIEQLRAEYGDDASLLLAAGDSIGATLYASASQDDTPTLEVLNALEVDASATGNHEFDGGIDDLQGRVRDTADFPYLAANVTRGGVPIDDGYALFEANGVSVAVIGAVTLETPALVDPSGIAGVTFTDPVAAVNAIAARLSDGDAANGEAELIVAEYHEGSQAALALNAPQDVQAAALNASMDQSEAFRSIVEDTAAEVDVIFNGHTHQAYSWLAPAPAGSEQDVRPVVQSGQYGENISQVVAVIDPVTGAATFPTVQNVARTTAPAAELIASYPRVAAVDAITSAALERAAVIGREPLGEITGDITTAFAGGKRDDRGSASTMGTLVGNMLRDQLASANRGGAQIGITNPGGLRDEFLFKAAAGEPTDGVVTVGEAAAVLPFANNLWTVTLTGEQLKVVLEQQWQRSATGTVPSRAYLQLGFSDNVEYTYDSTLPEGSRITGIWIDESPVTPTQEIRVAAPSFLISGGDNFRGFTAGTNAKDSGLVDSQAFQAYIEARSPISPDFSRRELEIIGVPTAPVAVGTEITLTVNKVDLTSLGTPTSTEVELYQGDTLLGAFPVASNSATVTFDVQLPKGRAVYEIRTPSGTGIGFSIPVDFEADRVGGADRFEVAVNLSEQAYPSGAPVVYVASGEVWTDALSAGPAAAREGGPLLLVRKGEAPQIVLDEIARLGADRVVIVGGEQTIAASTEARIAAIAAVERVAGADRFDTSLMVAQRAFPDADGAYAATGLSFTDALSAGAAAGHLGWPLVLVDTRVAVPSATTAALAGIGVDRVRVAGGMVTVPSRIVADLVDAGFTVSRLGGADRFDVSAAITASAFQDETSNAYLASGVSFPDALAGAAVAGAQDVPLMIVRPDCVPERIHGQLERLAVSTVTLVGGEASLSESVASLTVCG